MSNLPEDKIRTQDASTTSDKGSTMTFDPTAEIWWVDDDGQVLTRDLAVGGPTSEFLAFLAPYQHSDNDGGEKPDEKEFARRNARARLASAAPDMARVLLRIEHGGLGDTCLSCWSRPHEPDCALAAALRKIGVR